MSADTNRQITRFLLYCFGISYLIGLPFSILVAPVLKDSHALAGIYIPRLFVVLGPAIAAIAASMADGVSGSTRLLLEKAAPRPRQILWLLVLPVSGIGLALLAFQLSGTPAITILQVLPSYWGLLAGNFAIQFFVVGLGEELGWRGWLLPTMLRDKSWLVATLSVALIWGLWHGPVLVSGWAIAIPFAVIILSLSIIFSFLWYETNHDIVVLAIAHASFNTPFFLVEQLANLGELVGTSFSRAWQWLAVIYLALATVVLVTRWAWWQSNDNSFFGNRADGPA